MQHQNLLTHGPRRVSPFFVPMLIANMASGIVAILTGAKGPNMAIITACATATHSTGEAWHMIRRGDADAMIVGGSEAAIRPLSCAGFCTMKAMSTRNDDPEHASRPYDKDRDGFVMGEGAGILVIEELEHAKARGARIYAELVGYGCSADAYHMVAIDHRGATRSMQNALASGQDCSRTDRLRQRARHRDSHRRYRGDQGDQVGAGRPREKDHGQLHQVHARAPLGRGGCG